MCNFPAEVDSWPLLVIVEREILCAAHGHRLGRLRLELGELVGLLCGALLRAPQYQPGGPAGRQGLACRLRHHREGLAPPLASGWQGLSLVYATDIGGHAALAPRVALGLKLAQQLYGCPTARVQVRCSNIGRNVSAPGYAHPCYPSSSSSNALASWRSAVVKALREPAIDRC
jgi:hypothetical protein